MTAATEGLRPATISPRLRALVELLSSMRFAISLLTVICIASVIGTILKQAEPAANYVNQFGPFWSQLFLALRLNTVYSAWWFLLILAFLVTSTSLCIARQTPKILADLRTLKEGMREQALQSFKHRAQAGVDGSPEVAARRIGDALARAGWKVKLQQRASARGEGWMVAARAGAANKIGYLAAHSAIVLVCLGGLSDGDLIVRAQMLLGGKTPYAGGGMIADVPAQHRLGAANPTFRGNLLVAEGTQAGTAVLSQPDGILLQELPFSIELKKFIVEYYSTGMPKLFASEIIIHDKETGEAVPARVEVNHPARWRGVEIYQSSFDDGGSSVKLAAVPINGESKRFELQGVIGGTSQLAKGQGTGAETMTLEYTGLRVINVENMGEASRSGADPRKVDLQVSLGQHLGAANKAGGKKELRNIGPSISYKLRDAAGQAREFNNYMLPVDMGDGVPVFLLGMRETPADQFRYLRVPADDKGSLDGFVRLRAALADPAARREAVSRYSAKATDPSKPEVTEQLAGSAAQAVALFAGDAAAGGKGAGLGAVSDYLEARVPEAERNRAGEVVVRILGGVLFELAQLTREQAGLPALASDERTQAFMAQAVMALSDSFLYPAPMAFQLQDFQQVQASVFQVTRSPGRNVVYLGCALLIIGVFAMLYVRERRLWVWLTPDTGGSAAAMALSSNRQTLDVDREFARLRTQLLGS
ncbi:MULTISPECIES: cytochrome c biogenesis protein ResB [Ramlibacter]|uniref:Cytochrome c biogenesis protein ResB n=1 Tax=Ramlibacter pinisoli TaxID=2682844 RepID=A0A6N8J2Q2_9BURK|nr:MULTISPECIES: cytochrome c biogenesis protein ResB [Ramlibacter]MBA2962591.1 cytochrome c biogenesis protein ResB [Ramlibacter sp. CGMCC 1.13660]MVQ32533.1 cytochrome c biogenesis protein ResB [Ramlibacter pinisoli]